jgi:hypothetical protein
LLDFTFILGRPKFVYQSQCFYTLRIFVGFSLRTASFKQ